MTLPDCVTYSELLRDERLEDEARELDADFYGSGIESSTAEPSDLGGDG